VPAKLIRDFFVYQPPYSLFGFSDEPATTGGAIWLEVVYARGLAVGGGRIEIPSHPE